MAISHQTVRLGAGRHPRPGSVVCVMELASMLGGGRFCDRPESVCPVIGSILRVYNDNVDDDRRQDLYRFAADAVDTRRDYRVQRRRADAALKWAGERYCERGDTLLAPPDPEGPRDEIAYYVIGALGRRDRWSDRDHAAVVALLDGLIEIDAAPELAAPLLGDLLEQIPQALEHGGGCHEFVLAEALQCRAEARLEASAPLLDEPATVVGQAGEHHAPISIGTLARDESGCREAVEHLGDARGAQIGGTGEIANRHLTLVAKAEQQPVLRVGELAGSMRLASAQPAHGGHRALERSRNVLGGVALLALAYHVAKRA
jgi:hypothetical protein